MVLFHPELEMEMFSISKEISEEYEEIADIWVISKEDLINNILEFAPHSGKEFYV